MATWKMEYKKGCKWTEEVVIDKLKCVKDKGADEMTCRECELRKM